MARLTFDIESQVDHVEDVEDSPRANTYVVSLIDIHSILPPEQLIRGRLDLEESMEICCRKFRNMLSDVC